MPRSPGGLGGDSAPVLGPESCLDRGGGGCVWPHRVGRVVRAEGPRVLVGSRWPGSLSSTTWWSRPRGAGDLEAPRCRRPSFSCGLLGVRSKEQKEQKTQMGSKAGEASNQPSDLLDLRPTTCLRLHEICRGAPSLGWTSQSSHLHDSFHLPV